MLTAAADVVEELPVDVVSWKPSTQMLFGPPSVAVPSDWTRMESADPRNEPPNRSDDKT